MRLVQVKSILNKTKRRDPWFLDDYTINPYSGCSFNCLYCYIRGSKYGVNMAERLAVKENAIELLDRQLFNRAKKGQYGVIALSSATDPYLQLESKTGLTRGILEVISRHRFPLHLITKSDLVLRDLDLLKKVEERAVLPADLQVSRKVFLTFSFSTLDDDVNKIFELGATPPTKRLQALQKVKQAGFLTGASLMPLLPYITDTDSHLDYMFKSFAAIPVDYIFPASITLFGNGPADSKTLMLKAIAQEYPELLEKYEKLSSVPKYLSNYKAKLKRRTDELLRRYKLSDRIN
ncbi:MAG: radical SAM protein [Cyclobacteriaceae bacterium]|nr:radical SAM protein [Cyclobacteriaceae bacterium HetDA_MAG_MS6]